MERDIRVAGKRIVWDVSISVFAHEYGHALGLFHHQDSLYVMQSGTTRLGPNPPYDIRQNENCTGSTPFWGVSCIYQTN